jgi:hypothetical protein
VVCEIGELDVMDGNAVECSDRLREVRWCNGNTRKGPGSVGRPAIERRNQEGQLGSLSVAKDGTKSGAVQHGGVVV